MLSVMFLLLYWVSLCWVSRRPCRLYGLYLCGGNDGLIRRHRKVDPRIGNQVRLELVQVDVQGSVESAIKKKLRHQVFRISENWVIRHQRPHFCQKWVSKSLSLIFIFHEKSYFTKSCYFFILANVFLGVGTYATWLHSCDSQDEGGDAGVGRSTSLI
jgi:hypothetical protein